MTKPTIGEPHLFGEERVLFGRTLEEWGGRYLEFGMGGSTIAAMKRGAFVVAVESDPSWVDVVRDHPEGEAATREGRAKLLHVDIGPVGKLGFPIGTQDAAKWPRYVAAPWREWTVTRADAPGLVYVDGRFRVACCASVLASLAAWRGTGLETRVLLHDYGDDRRYYDPIFELFEIVERINTLCLLRPRADATPTLALAMALEFVSDPR